MANSHMSETNKANNGMNMTLTKYINSKEVHVKFEDGTETKTSYDHFKTGQVLNPNYDKLTRTGLTTYAKNGLKVTIIEYRNCNDIKVQFEDGIEIDHTTFRRFKNGYIKHPRISCENVRAKNRSVGTKSIASNGMEITIVDYRNRNDFDVQFADGTIYTCHAGYSYFKNGRIAYPKGMRVGQTKIATNGQKMSIIRYKSATDIDIKFEDGTIVTNKKYCDFQKGTIKNPNAPTKYKTKFHNRTGCSIITDEGLKLTITKYVRYEECYMAFQDGAQVKSDYSRFKQGLIKHPFPYRLGSMTMTRLAYATNHEENFYCYCNKCGLVDIMSVDEMKNHICQETING